MAKSIKSVPFTEFTDPQSQLVTSENHNAFDLYCAQGCALILRANLGKWVERPKNKLKIPDGKESDSDNSSDDDSSNQGFWALNDVMAFENIDVTNTIVTGIKYLCCPGCDLAPLGYHDTNTKNEFLIAVDRVSYFRE
ncbi:1478_t:CDS:2 [Funneliformis geosporum]|uniref:14938_t:CDS:1 n=1 Tax=Funneliformis geosporum TaxID=1117311 RepID=A0A9W4WS50_9GLOM|nr:14938_t:CDS:2 [Funneliformis geosporum]CAI2175063.1 1478_t:CDS:2 [Funneliformis geosporum]